MFSMETEMNSCRRDNCLRKKRENEQRRLLWRTAQLGSQIPLKGHWQPASRAQDFRRYFSLIRGIRGRLWFRRGMRLRTKATLQGNQFASDRSAKETIIADLHKGMREDML